MENRFAGFWIRAVAIIIDGIILFLAQMIILIPFGFEQNGEVNLMLNIFLIILGFLYYSIMHSSKWQATIGKKLMKIYVIKKDGTKLSFLRALARAFCTSISSLPLGIGYIWAGFDKKKRTFHDMICGTYVVKR